MKEQGKGGDMTNRATNDQGENARKWASGSLSPIEYFERAYKREREEARREVDRRLRVGRLANTRRAAAG